MSDNFKIFETNQFLNDLSRADQSRSLRIGKKLQKYVYPRLKSEPHWGANIKRLRAWDPPTWRYRIGDWRFFYTIDEKTKMVSMVAASDRKEAYR